MPLEQLDDDLWAVTHPLRFLGLELGTRMTVVRIGEDLLLHSPVPADDALRDEIESLGRVRWVVGPNKFHHMYLAPWVEVGAEAWGVAGLDKKRDDVTFAGTVTGDAPWTEALPTLVLEGIPFTGEAVFHHPASRTLIVTDLAFNIQPDAPWITRVGMRLAGAYPGVCCSLLEKLVVKRDVMRPELERVLSWDFERVILSHGAVVETDGRDRLREAYRWLGIDSALPAG